MTRREFITFFGCGPTWPLAASGHQLPVVSIVLASILVCCLSVPTHADECDTVAAKIVASERATITRRDPLNMLELQHPFVGVISLDCNPRLHPDVNVAWSGPHPPASFFDVAGRLGSIVTGVSPDIVKEGALKCNQQALQPKDKLSELKFRGVVFLCSYSTALDQLSIDIDSNQH
jgi:hypothetical protein